MAFIKQAQGLQLYKYSWVIIRYCMVSRYLFSELEEVSQAWYHELGLVKVNNEKFEEKGVLIKEELVISGLCLFGSAFIKEKLLSWIYACCWRGWSCNYFITVAEKR